MDYEPLVKEYVSLADQKAQIDERLDALKAELRTLGEGSHDIAGVKVSIAPNRRIDTKLVEQQYPIAKHRELYTAKPDPAKIRQHLAPIRVEQLMTETGEPKVSIR